MPKPPKLNIDWVRVEAGIYGLVEIDHQPNIGMISFRISNTKRLNIYLTKGTVVYAPKRRKQVITKNCNIDDVAEMMLWHTKNINW